MGQLIRQDCATEILPPEPQWRRNGYWLPITTPSDSEEKCVILKAVFDSNQEWMALSATGDYTVDWGDGNIENFASGVTAEHTYNYADVDLYDSSATLGYKQAIIQVYPQAGQQLTSLNLHVPHSLSGSSIYDSGFLDIRITGQYLTDLLLGCLTHAAYSYRITMAMLESLSISKNNIANFNYVVSALVSLENMPVCYVENATSLIGFGRGLLKIKEYPKLETSKAESLYDAFYSNFNLTTSPVIDTSACKDFTNFLRSCSSLKTMYAYNTSNAETMSGFANGCTALKNVPNLNTSKCTNFSACFAGCTCLLEQPLHDTTLATNLSLYMNSDFSIRTIDFAALNLGNCTNLSNSFAGLFIKNKIILPNTPGVTTYLNFLSGCFFAETLNGTLQCNVATAIGSIFGAGGANVDGVIFNNAHVSFGVPNCKYSKSNLEALLAAAGSANTGTQTITISGNPGTGTIYSKTATTTLGSKTVTMADTSNINIGDRMTGTGSPLTTAIAVTFTDAGDTVNLVNHQLPNGHPVSFPSITTTTGIVIRTIYYVVNATTDNFQVSATVGGAALALTSNGSGTMIYDAVIESIDPNVSITLSTPATSNSTGSKSFRSLNTAPALLRGFTISG